MNTKRGESDESKARDELRPSSPVTGVILAVDDDVLACDMVKGIVNALGYEVACAINRRVAAGYYAAHKDEVDLVLLDMELPVVDGRECCRQLRRIGPGMKMIISNGNTHEGALQQTRDEGTLGLLSQPYEMMRLAEFLEEGLPSLSAKPGLLARLPALF